MARTSILRCLSLCILLLAPEAKATMAQTSLRSAILRSQLTYSTAAQTLASSVCSGIMTVVTKNSAGVIANVSSNLTVNLNSSAGSLTFYSDSACTTVITNITVASGTSSTSFYFVDTLAGSPLITISATAYDSASQTETISSNGFVWTGGGVNAFWSTGTNWSGGAAPNAATAVAVFDGTCSSNCSPTISATISSGKLGGVRITSAYSGIITQSSGSAITVGASGWSQLGGSFIGSSGGDAITVNGVFAVSSGASFTSTTGILEAITNFTITGTFTPNNGTVQFGGASTTNSGTITPSSITYYNVSFDGEYTPTWNLGGNTMTIAGTLFLDGTGGSGDTYETEINNGTLVALGNVTVLNNGAIGTVTLQVSGSANQTITGVSTGTIPNLVIASTGGTVSLSGTLVFLANFTYQSGTVNAGTSSVDFGLASVESTQSITPGGISLYNVGFSGEYSSTFNLNSGTMTVTGTLLLSGGGSQQAVINSGTFVVQGNVTSQGYGAKGTAVIEIAGSGNQTITGTGTTAYFPSLTIASTGGTVTLSGTPILYGTSYTYSSGTVNTGTSTLQFGDSNYNATMSVTPGPVTYNNVALILEYTPSVFNLNGGTMNIAGNIIIGSTSGAINNGNLALKGNLSTSSNGMTGTATIQFVGSSTQSVTVGSGASLPSGAVTVNNSSSTLTLASAVSWNSVGQSLTLTAGAINMAGYALTLKALSLNSNTLTKNAGVLTVAGTVAGTGSLFGGTVAP